MQKWLLHCACVSVKQTQPKLLKVAPCHQNRTKQREILSLEKVIPPARIVTMCDMHKSNSGFCTSLDTLGEINFQLKLFLKTSNFLIWKLLFKAKKISSKVVGTFKKFEKWGTETFSDWSKTQTPCDMAVIDINQWVSMEKVWLFNVAPLDGITAYAYGHDQKSWT